MLAQRTDIHEKDCLLTFEEIYQEYGERILNLAYRMIGREDAARDLTQDIFIKVYENLASFRGDAQVYTWIHRIATNHILNYLKKNRRWHWLNLMDKSIGEVLQEAEVEADIRGGGMPRPDQVLEKRQREKLVMKAIQSLPAKYRVPFVLHRYEGMSYQEIADQMGLSLSALEARIHRAKKMLVGKLEPLAGDI